MVETFLIYTLRYTQGRRDTPVASPVTGHKLEKSDDRPHGWRQYRSPFTDPQPKKIKRLRYSDFQPPSRVQSGASSRLAANQSRSIKYSSAMASDFTSRAGLPYAGQLRSEIAQRNRLYARSHAHVESYGASPVIVYVQEGGMHGNFYPPAYVAIATRPKWMRRFDKIHAQGRSLPKPQLDPMRKWRELDSSMSSDALLMNIFCTPGVAASPSFKRILGVDTAAEPDFGWKARVPLKNNRVDRTEVDLRWGNLLVEAKLTESDFQFRETNLVEAYRDFDEVFDRELLPRVQIRIRRRREAVELAEEFSQEWEPPSEGHGASCACIPSQPGIAGRCRTAVAVRLRKLSAHSECTGSPCYGRKFLRDPRPAAPRSTRSLV